MSETLQGKVKWFNDAKGYGFVEHSSGRDVFVHYSVIQSDGYKTLKDGEAVEYEITEGDKGLHAKNVRRVAAANGSSKLNIEVLVEPDATPQINSPGADVEGAGAGETTQIEG